MTEVLAKKKRIRAGHKASSTKTIKHVEDILTSDTFNTQKMTLSEKLKTITALDSKVIDLIDNEEVLITEIEQASDYKEGVFSALIRIDQASETPPLQSLSPMTCINIHTMPTEACSTSVRFPKLQLRSFGGNLTKWMSF